MTSSVPEKISYFARASFYKPDDNGNIVSFKKLRVANLVLECPPLRCRGDVDRYILPKLRQMCNEEKVVCDIELISPVCWPSMFVQEQEKHTAALKTVIFNRPGSGKTAFNSVNTVMKQAAHLKFNKLPPETERFFDGFLLFHLIPEAEYETEEKLALIEHYLNVCKELSSLSGNSHNETLREKMYAKAEQLIAAR
ncbi:hypothetical protein [Neisseria sp.]|uniref:hypothetical protein n=1 Tax=Neisseria sp. TaxID=192066 RepID=UPI0026DA8101|nr:hypothetical protein [Neisseria sp.]MDO4226199.1 hypothetical protein [Neisseria sp.]